MRATRMGEYSTSITKVMQLDRALVCQDDAYLDELGHEFPVMSCKLQHGVFFFLG